MFNTILSLIELNKFGWIIFWIIAVVFVFRVIHMILLSLATCTKWLHAILLILLSIINHALWLFGLAIWVSHFIIGSLVLLSAFGFGTLSSLVVQNIITEPKTYNDEYSDEYSIDITKKESNYSEYENLSESEKEEIVKKLMSERENQ